MRRTNQTYSQNSDLVDVFHRTIPDGSRSFFVDAVLLTKLVEVNQKLFKEAKSTEKQAEATLNINKLKRAAESLTKALTEADSRKMKARRLILVEEANVQ